MDSRAILSFHFFTYSNSDVKDSMKDSGKGDNEMNDRYLICIFPIQNEQNSDISREGFKKMSFVWLQSKRVSSNLRL